MKKNYLMAAAFVFSLMSVTTGCNDGKTQNGGSADSTVVADSNAVKTDTLEAEAPKVSEEEVKEDVSKVALALFREATKLNGNYMKYLTPEFKEVLDKVNDLQNRTGDLILDYDPILNAQDYPDNPKPKVVSFELKSGKEAVAKVQVWKGNNRTLTVKLIDDEWLVDDVSGEKAKLKKLLK